MNVSVNNTLSSKMSLIKYSIEQLLLECGMVNIVNRFDYYQFIVFSCVGLWFSLSVSALRQLAYSWVNMSQGDWLHM